VSLAGRPGSIALTDRPGRLVVAVEHQLAWLDWQSGRLEPWLDVEAGGTGNRLNDGRADRRGRFWVGSMFEDTRAGRSTGMLHRIDAAGKVATLRRGVGVSNGLAFSPDGTVMYWADSNERIVWSYRYDGDSGRASDPSVLVEFGELPGFPDGACVDAAGCYWAANVHGWAITRVDPAGRVDRIVELPFARPTMPAFGGTGLDVLYVTSIGPNPS
jgi:sugar lactone lactonase YvrE